MELEKGYKQTEVGVIPEGWNLKVFKDICWVNQGLQIPIEKRLKYQAIKSKVYITIQFLNDSKQIEYINDYSPSVCCNHDDILMTRTGNTGIVVTNVDGVFHNNFFKINYDKKQVIKDFLVYYLCQNKTKKIILDKAGTSTIPDLNHKDFYSIPIILPTTFEQAVIANALSDADEWIQSLTKLIAKKRQIKQGVMQALLYPYDKIGRLKEGWNIQSIFELAEGKKELFDDGDWIESEHITSQGVRLIQTGNIGVGIYVEKEIKKYIYEESFKKLRCKPLREGDLLICRLAEPAGRACIFPNISEEKVVTSVDVTIFRPSTELVDRYYLATLFSTNEWFIKVGESVGGTTHKRISRGSLGRIEIALPSIKEQRASAAIFSNMDNEITALETKLEKAKKIKQGMMQNLLTGKIRLV